MPDPLASLAAVLTGRYRILRELGAGGMATVYLAEDTKHHRQVAVKMLRPELAATLGTERFLREIEIAAGLHHPHILPLYDSGGADGVLFYVMPYVEGQSLRDRLDKVGALPVDEAVRIIREVADALEYSHRHGVVHRDIKPENILLADAHALVMDFGIAKAVSDASSTAQLTSTGMSLGTPTYMAPEQATADPNIDHRVDIYALGVMAYEILAGRAPFLGNPQQVLAGHLTRPPEALSIHRNSVPRALEAVVMRALEKNPSDRWQSAGDMLRALEAIPSSSAGVQSASATLTDAPATPTVPRRGRRRVGIAAGTGVAVLLAAAGLAWFGKVGRAGTLIGNDVLAENDLVLVSEFQNRTADSTLASTVTDAIRVELQQSRVVKVMSQSAMWAGLGRMGLAHGTALPVTQVKELAEREGAKAFIVGDIAKIGSGYQLTARVVATAGGSEALTARATADDETKLIGAVEDLGRKLRRGIGESLRSVQAAPALAKVTTASLPALRAYSAALRAEIDGDRARAITLAKQALSLDSTFAGAWDGLYTMYSNNNAVQQATDAETRAFALKDHLSEVEALRVTARYHGVRGEYAEEEAAWARLAELGRDEVNYANLLLELRRFPEAEALARRGVASEPKHPIGYWNLIEAQVAQQHYAAAESTLATMAKKLPDGQWTSQLTASIPASRRDYGAVEAFLQTPQGMKFQFATGFECAVNLHRGRLRTWAACPASPLKWNPYLALAEYRMNGDTLRARRAYAPFLATAPEARDADLYATTIALLAEVGHVREAHRLLDEWRARSRNGDPAFRADSGLATGAIAAAEGQWDRAATAFLVWNVAPMPSAMHLYNRGLPEAAIAVDRMGKPDSAIVLLERALALPSIAGGLQYETGWYAFALQKLGDLYEARGDRTKAAAYYAQYVDLLKDADPPLASQVVAVKAKLTRVRGEPVAATRRP